MTWYQGLYDHSVLAPAVHN